MALAAGALLAPAVLIGGPVDPYRKRYNQFAEAMARWVKRILAISPSSPNFHQVGAEVWYELQVGEWFRELERVVTDWRRAN